ncbi:MAG: hypothetical protein C0425_08265 [Chlorobiaceae bacterium]|nr:hypothetical protein [Chlorobiaceae bacterium]MBA4310315.1 hypothetical protein [Chlorobiaceae bacterium]
MNKLLRKFNAKNSLLKGVLVLFLIPYLLNFVGCSGCIYSFTGASVPPHLKSIAIPFADDRSGAGEPMLRELITQKLTDKFIQDNSLRIADRSTANAILETVITGLQDAPAVLVSGETVETRRITISVQVVYRDLVQRKTIFEKQFSNYGDYSVGGGTDSRNASITLAIDRITEDILLDTVSGW